MADAVFTDGKDSGMEFEVATRVQLSQAAIDVEGRCAEGRIENLSATGVRIEDPDLLPRIGSQATLFRVLPGAEPFELPGSVVRHTTSGGFCMAFSEQQERLGAILDRYLTDVRELESRTKGARAQSALVD